MPYEKEDTFNLKEIEKKYPNGEHQHQQQFSNSLSKFADALLRCTFLFEDNTGGVEEHVSKKSSSSTMMKSLEFH